MNYPEYPVYLTEVNCCPLYAFRFNLPPQNEGWNCVTLYVEYDYADKTHDATAYQVWAQFEEAVFRGYLCSGIVPYAPTNKDIIWLIANDINNCEKFHEEIYKFMNAIATAV